MTNAIGQEDYRPRWAGRGGCWAQQRVPLQTGQPGGLLWQYVPPIGEQYLVWVPSRFAEPEDEPVKALEELRRIPFFCEHCDWEGFGGDLVGSRSGDPTWWPLLCPRCGQDAIQDIRYLDQGKVLQRWEAAGRPKIEHPNFSPYVKDIPITDLPDIMERMQPMPNELAYIAQQLWPSLPQAILHGSSTGGARQLADPSLPPETEPRAAKEAVPAVAHPYERERQGLLALAALPREVREELELTGLAALFNAVITFSFLIFVWPMLLVAFVLAIPLSVLAAVPLVGGLALLLVNLPHVVFWGALMGSSWVWERVPVARPFLGLVGVPIAIVDSLTLVAVAAVLENPADILEPSLAWPGSTRAFRRRTRPW
jgi:hypothetical protein